MHDHDTSLHSSKIHAVIGGVYYKKLLIHCLARHFLLRLLLQIAAKAVPYHADFTKLLGSDGTPEYDQAVLKDMSLLSESLEKLTTILKETYELYELDAPTKEL